MKKTYKTFSFSEKPDWEKVPEGEIAFYNWGSEAEYKTTFKLCLAEKKGIFLRMKTDEKNLRAVCENTDENIWEDSCMEFFLKPFPYKEDYINFEMNSKGAYLSEVGPGGRPKRRFLKDITPLKPELTSEVTTEGWSLQLFVPAELISAAFGEEFEAGECLMKGNFYKCGDLTEKPHYGSFSETTTLPPGFHNPECFADIIVTKER